MLSPARWILHRSLAPHVRFASSVIPAPRRGRNLTERYRRLENTARTQTLLPQGSTSAAGLHPNRPAPARTRTPTTVNTIAGFVIPEVPRPPADDECCMSGCAVCVYDLYEEALAAYKDSVDKLRTSLSVLHIPETEWPSHIRTDNGADTSSIPQRTTTEKSKDAVLDTFEAMERALREKREKRAAVEAEKRARGEVLVGDGERVQLDLRGVYEGIKWIIFPNR